MQTKMLVKKPELVPGRTNNQKNKPAANKKNVRTTDYKKLLRIMLNDPDAITREEFMVLQSAIGYRQTVELREEAKQRKKQKKLEQANNWLSKYSKKDDAAYYAGWIVCKEYEKPKADSSDARGKSAAKIYKVMMGLK